MTTDRARWNAAVSVSLDQDTLALVDAVADARHDRNRSAAVRAAIHAYAADVLGLTPMAGVPTSGSQKP